MKNELTLLAISSIFIKETIDSLLTSSDKMDFKEIKIFTHEKPANLPSKIKYVNIKKINNIMDFNNFCFYEVGDYIETTHALFTQYHAWILDGDIFNNDWLKYDYCGAVWPIRQGSFRGNNGEIVRNGNGGFSLRSKKIMSIPKKLNWPLREEQGFYNEDGNICCYYRKEFLELGIKYAPIEVAADFAFENVVIENYGRRTFGFHRNMNPWN